jgi:hypothetical protein
MLKYYVKVTKTQNARISKCSNILYKKLIKYYYQQIPLIGYLTTTTTTTLYYTLLNINYYSVRSLFVQSLFVATTTPCNCSARHQYEQYKKSTVYNTSYDNDINQHVLLSMDVFLLPGDAKW